MSILSTYTLENNKNIRFNFEGGELTSDSGLMLISEFAEKMGFTKVIREFFHTRDTAKHRRHTDYENYMQLVYQIIGGYFTDDCADALRKEPLLTQLLRKDHLASQPTLSRFMNRMDQYTLDLLETIQRQLRYKLYQIQRPEHVLFDIDSTLCNTYGHQEGACFNFHYQANGYHPLLCYDGLTGDLLRCELRDGSQYCGKGSAAFMRPLLQEYHNYYPYIERYLRGDCGFATPELYELCEMYVCKCAIRLKENATLHELSRKADEQLYELAQEKPLDYLVIYGEFEYQASSWDKPRRVCYKIEKPEGQLTHLYTYVVTTMDGLDAHEVIQFYCARGKMENFIKEGKSGFDLDSVSSQTKIVNANRFLIHAMIYNLFNWFRRLVLPDSMRTQQIDTIRLKLLKIAGRVIRSARYNVFKLCSSFPHRKEFLETLQNIRSLQPLLE